MSTPIHFDPAVNSYETSIVFAAVSHLCASATFRGLVGADTPDAAQGRIVLFDGGSAQSVGIAMDGTTIETVNATAWAHVCEHLPDMTRERLATTIWSSTGTLPIRIWMRRPKNAHPAQWYLSLLDALGHIRTEMESMCGKPATDTDRYFHYLTITTKIEQLPDDAGYARDFLTGLLTLIWSDLP